VSLLADLLSKVKQQQTKREITPNLKDIIAKDSAHKKKIVLYSALFGAVVISGILTVYLLQSLVAPSAKKTIAVQKPQRITAQAPKMVLPQPAAEAPESRPETKAEKKIEKNIAGTEKTAKEKSSAIAEKPEKTEGRMTARIEKKEKPSPEPAVKPKPPVRPQAERSEDSAEEKSASQPQKNAYLYIAKDYENKKDYPNALAYYKKVLETDKNNFAVINNTAYILLNMGLVHESIKYSQMALELKADYVPALINLGVAYARVDNINAAETYLNKAVTIAPDNQTAAMNLAVLYEKQREYQKAFEYFSKLARMGNANGLLGIARIYEKQAKTEEALKTYKNISSFSSIDDDTRKMVEQRIELLNERLKSK